MAAGNTRIESFATGKRLLKTAIYTDYRQTLYCGVSFAEDGKADLPEAFQCRTYRARARRVEWEHAVPAEHFGRTFSQWRDGDPRCRDRRGRPFRGRSCAQKISREFRLMQADMHNIFPALGAVNAARGNYSFRLLPDVPPRHLIPAP